MRQSDLERPQSSISATTSYDTPHPQRCASTASVATCQVSAPTLLGTTSPSLTPAHLSRIRISGPTSTPLAPLAVSPILPGEVNACTAPRPRMNRQRSDRPASGATSSSSRTSTSTKRCPSPVATESATAVVPNYSSSWTTSTKLPSTATISPITLSYAPPGAPFAVPPHAETTHQSASHAPPTRRTTAPLPPTTVRASHDPAPRTPIPDAKPRPEPSPDQLVRAPYRHPRITPKDPRPRPAPPPRPRRRRRPRAQRRCQPPPRGMVPPYPQMPFTP